MKRFLRSSELNVGGKGDDLLIAVIKAVKGSCYLSGYGASKYQDPEKFKKAGLDFKYYSYKPPIYPQLWGEFVPNLSILDVLPEVFKSKHIVCRYRRRVGWLIT